MPTFAIYIDRRRVATRLEGLGRRGEAAKIFHAPCGSDGLEVEKQRFNATGYATKAMTSAYEKGMKSVEAVQLAVYVNTGGTRGVSMSDDDFKWISGVFANPGPNPYDEEGGFPYVPVMKTTARDFGVFKDDDKADSYLVWWSPPPQPHENDEAKDHHAVVRKKVLAQDMYRPGDLEASLRAAGRAFEAANSNGIANMLIRAAQGVAIHKEGAGAAGASARDELVDEVTSILEGVRLGNKWNTDSFFDTPLDFETKR